MSAEGVPDGGSQSKHVVGVELEIIRNEVVVHLGAYEDIPESIVADSKSAMQQEMIAVDVGTAAVIPNADAMRVEQQALHPGPTHEVGVSLRSHPSGVNQVRIEKHRPIVLVTVVDALMVAERSLQCDPDVSFIQMLESKAGKHAGLFRRRKIGLGRIVVLRGPERAASDGKIRLLCVREASKKQETE